MSVEELRLSVPGTRAEAGSASPRLAPFLAHDALLGLALAPPVLTLLIAQQGLHPTLVHAAGCLLGTWICTVVVGFPLHFIVNWSAPRLLKAVRLPAAYLGIAAVTAGAIVGGMWLVLPRLTWVHGEDLTLNILRALAIGSIYVALARVVVVVRVRRRATEASAHRARIAALQAQVSPHFLFNTLNAVASLIPAEPELAEATIERLAGVLQYSISSGNAPTVSLEEELATVKDYLGIEQARFGPRLRSCIDVSPELNAQLIPPMLLQPLVENAVLHGFGSREEGGEIWISGRAEHGDLVLTVSDDGVGPNGSKRRGNGTAHRNIRERLALTYGDAAAFLVRGRVGGGFECELRVPRA